jgi:hypothetical protein
VFLAEAMPGDRQPTWQSLYGARLTSG